MLVLRFCTAGVGTVRSFVKKEVQGTMRLSFLEVSFMISLMTLCASPVFGTVKLQHIALGIIILDYFVRRDNDMSAMMGHLGGALMGFLIIRQGKKGRNLAGWLEWVFDAIMSIVPTKVAPRSRFNVFKRKTKSKSSSSRAKSDDQFNSERREKELKVDSILDKISRHGYDHLTKDEKEFLFKQSKE